jgi:hypothetical protein
MERVRVSMSVEEKIGLPNFSNVVIGPISLESWCDDTPEARKAALKEITEECEEHLGVERTKVLEWLKKEGLT